MESYTITLSAVDLGQMLHALEDRAEAWEATAQVLRGERSDVLIEECNNEQEATLIAAHYRRIAEEIRLHVGW